MPTSQIAGVEFDRKKNNKASRMPLGFAAKMFVPVGDIDRNGHAATQAGWYYKWYRGIHILCGEEGAGRYKHRPSHEDTMPEMWYYDIDFRCQVQEKEHGDEETKDVETRVGSFSVPSLILIVKNPDSTMMTVARRGQSSRSRNWSVKALPPWTKETSVQVEIFGEHG